MVGLRRRYTPRNDEGVGARFTVMTGVWHRITRAAAITGVVGLRRRCAPRNDGGVGDRLTAMTGVWHRITRRSVMTSGGWIATSLRSSQ